MKNNYKKKGIALISLGIVVLILIMLSGFITYVSIDVISESEKVSFLKDITTIYEAVQEYYAVNGDIPSSDAGKVLGVDEYKSSQSSEAALNSLDIELIKNGDEQATFYEIDMSKIGIDKSIYGVKKTGDDLFLVSNVSQNIYYFPGIEIDNNIYFSNVFLIEK